MSKWTRACDRALHRLVSYLHATRTEALWIVVRMRAATEMTQIYVDSYVDADHGGDESGRSTSGWCTGHYEHPEQATLDWASKL